MALSPGTRLGAYQIHDLLGEGGMGQVYKARDSKLGRDVAIKVLPPSVANDPERLARFEREAKLLASLSHTNIAQIYGLEEEAPSTGSGPGRFLVMELAAGDDLTLRIGRGPMDLQEALPIMMQVAHALEAAHERAIVHRDLKPANIKLSEEGAVKVLDFGLAKAFATGDPSASAMNSPTLTAQATAAGVILGTAAYMSPEQARGREADKRADVWAFGVVFFELLTGSRLFQGETISDTLAAVLRQDIPWSTLPPGTPAEVTRLLRRCLERDRKNRIHDIADARIILEEISRGGVLTENGKAAGVSPAPNRLRSLALAAGVVAVLAAGFFAGRWSSSAVASTASNAGTIRLVVPMPPGVTEVEEPALAPDGSFVVFVGNSGSKASQLYVQRLDQSAPRPIERTDGAGQPMVSPDGRWIAFRRANHFERIAVDGGEPLRFADAPDSAPGAAWISPNTIILSTSWLGELSRVSPEGGDLRRASTLDASAGEIGHWFPSALPDGRHVLLTVWKKAAGLNDAEVGVLDLDTGKHQILFKGAEARYVAPGYIVFFRAGSYHAIRFDPATLTSSGDAIRILDDAFGNSPEGDSRQTDLTAGGTLVYLSGPMTQPRELAWISAGGKSEKLRFPARAYNSGSVSADGTRAAVGVLEAGRNVIRVLDLVGGNEDSLDLPGSNWQPIWQPDGKRLAYRAMRTGTFDVFWKDMTTAAPDEPLLVSEFDDSPYAFLPDGKSIAVEQSNREGLYEPKLMPLAPRGPLVTLVKQNIDSLEVSRDGGQISFISSRSGVGELYVQPLAAGAASQKISASGASIAAWSRDGRDLLYLREPEIMAVSFKIENGRFRSTGERVWARVEGDYSEHVFSPAPDGRVLVAMTKAATAREIRVVVNWQQEIAKKVK
jgi:eukaryotic-like serine/threonine-protein kinase